MWRGAAGRSGRGREGGCGGVGRAGGTAQRQGGGSRGAVWGCLPSGRGYPSPAPTLAEEKAGASMAPQPPHPCNPPPSRAAAPATYRHRTHRTLARGRASCPSRGGRAPIPPNVSGRPAVPREEGRPPDSGERGGVRPVLAAPCARYGLGSSPTPPAAPLPSPLGASRLRTPAAPRQWARRPPVVPAARPRARLPRGPPLAAYQRPSAAVSVWRVHLTTAGKLRGGNV